MSLTALARAKINLCLHVGPPREDGYHPIASLVAFADIGDLITVERSDRLSLRVTGPFADGLVGEGDNLVLKALRALGAATGSGEPPVAVTLDKRLPIAAGLGGGSSDAATALKLARDLLALDIDGADLAEVAALIGADGPMCLAARTAWVEGIGDRITPIDALPPLLAVLVNPRVASPTSAVYAAYDRAITGRADRPDLTGEQTAAGVADWLGGCRNDLQEPARARTSEIGTVLTAMAATPGNRLSRMSGSGATVFGLYEDPETAEAAAAYLADKHGDWWVTYCLLGDSAATLSE